MTPFAKIRPTTQTEMHSVCNIVSAYARLFPTQTLTGIAVSRGIAICFQLDIDWHDCSYALDALHNKTLRITGHNSDGMTEYALI